jgi:hypothetical protein
MSSFIDTINPTPFSFFDSDIDFQTEADAMVTFVKRKLGDDILSVELSKKQIWACFEEASLEYINQINQYNIKSNLSNVLGLPTSSTDLTNKYTRQSLDWLMRMAEPYANHASVGGSDNQTLGYFDLSIGKQEYDFHTELKDIADDLLVFDKQPDGQKTRLRIVEIFHFDPFLSRNYLINSQNVINFLENNFNYESYTATRIYYALPVYNDVLRMSALETAATVRRSNYSYTVVGTKLRIFPIPFNQQTLGRMYVRVATLKNVINPDFTDHTINGVSGPHNAPYGVIPYNSIKQSGRQWIRQYTLALSKELLGLIRSKFTTVPIPNSELTLNGNDLVSQGREDKTNLTTQIKEFLDSLTNDKLVEKDAMAAENLAKQLKYVPVPLGKCIVIG